VVGRYCVCPALPLGSDRWSVREWDGTCVVFDGATGACHLLSEPAGAVFDALLRSAPGSMDAKQICVSVFGSDPDREPVDDEQAVKDLVAGLREAGLVQEAGV
jgi:PqqD family protein of HPr-rel-A system